MDTVHFSIPHGPPCPCPTLESCHWVQLLGVQGLWSTVFFCNCFVAWAPCLWVWNCSSSIASWRPFCAYMWAHTLLLLSSCNSKQSCLGFYLHIFGLVFSFDCETLNKIVTWISSVLTPYHKLFSKRAIWRRSLFLRHWIRSPPSLLRHRDDRWT